MERICYALDLVDDPALIKEYEEYHKKVWPEIIRLIRLEGVSEMQIYRVENRLFMITEMDASTEMNPISEELRSKDNEWQKLMWKYQQAIPRTTPGDKWRKMEKIFDLGEYDANGVHKDKA